jgi:type VI secretion system secreted protein VgrG
MPVREPQGAGMSETEIHSKYDVHLHCSALAEDALVVVRMSGHEEISRPFAFELVVRPLGEPLVFDDFEEIMGGTATISFGPQREHPIHGVVRGIDLMPTRDIAHLEYKIQVVPRLADTRLTRGSWIYQEKKPDEIIKAALSEILPEGARFADGDDFEFQLEGQYLPREYVVQYEESILDFVSRQAEHWGIFYVFDHSGETEKIVFGDTNNAFRALEGFDTIQFNPQTNVTDPAETLIEIGSGQRVVQHQVFLRDYNYRIPSVPLVTPPKQVDEKGIGDTHVTGDHFTTPDEGAMLAEIRSQELFSAKRFMRAVSRVRGLRAGHRFALAGGVPEQLGLAREYVVVAVDHEGGALEDGVSYRNTLLLMPIEMVFRPQRITPQPRIYGVMHAKIDSEAADDGVNVPVDEWGRYKVVMPFDVAGKTGGKSSCWIRICTSAGGGGWGVAQGLHNGVEVAIFHVDGDPDRPIIAGSVANFEQPAVVRRENANQCVMSSRNGIVMQFDDA